MAVLEGRWDCAQCQTTGILGRFKECPECHEPRDPATTPEETPYLPSDSAEVTDSDLLDLANAGPDWICGRCGIANRGNTNACNDCGRNKDSDDTVLRRTTYVGGTSAHGAVMSGAFEPADDVIEDNLDRATRIVEGHGEEPRVLEDRIEPSEALPRSGALADRMEGYRTDSAERDKLGPLMPVVRGYRDHRRGVFVAAGSAAGIVFILAAILIIRHFVATHPVDLTVTTLTWERRVEVEQYRTLTEEDWSVPPGGREQSTYEDIHHYVEVLDGYRTESYQESHVVSDGYDTETYNCGSRTVNDGNGFFHTETETCTRQVPRTKTVYETKTRQVPVTHQQPVYMTKYVYEIERWVFDRWVTSEGGNGELDRVPSWPVVPLLLKDERLSGRRESDYHVGLRSAENKAYAEDIDLKTWELLDVGDKLVGHIHNSGSLGSVDWPTKALAGTGS